MSYKEQHPESRDFSDLMEFIKNKISSPPNFDDLADVFGGTDTDEFRRYLEVLEVSGEIFIDHEDRVHLFSRQGRVLGRVRLDRRGAISILTNSPRRSYDVVHSEAGPVTAGDLVVAKTHAASSRKKGAHGKRRFPRKSPPNATIIKILTHNTQELHGVVTPGRRGGFLVRVFSPHLPRFVGLRAADAAHLVSGAVVALERVAASRRGIEARGVRVVGNLEDPRDDALFIMRAFGIEPSWPPDVLAAALAVDASIEAPNREDFTGLVTMTVDPEDAQDFDDAVSLERRGSGWRLGVHIADVSHYVPPLCALDREAMNRGTSVYLPGCVVPMLPERLSNDLCSLRPGEVRAVKTAFLDVDDSGNVTLHRLAKGAIRSRRRFSYEEVGAVLNGNPPADVSASMQSLVQDMRAVAMAMREQRRRRGALFLEISKGRVRVGPDGLLLSVEEDVQNTPHHMIEEFMLAANVAVARFFHQERLPLASRTHPRPEEDAMDELTAFVTDLGFRPGKGPLDLQALIRWAHGTRRRHSVNYALLRSLRQAEYSPTAGGHFALAQAHYCHFTSPIRRSPDLYVHQVLDARLSGTLTAEIHGRFRLRLPEICARAGIAERNAERAERELGRMKVLRSLESQRGAVFSGQVTGFCDAGVFVELDGLFTDGMALFTDMGGAKSSGSRFARTVHTRGGQRHMRLGDAAEVMVDRVDVPRRELDLVLMG